MKLVTIFLVLGLAALAQAQDQCAAVAASIPSCATSAIESAAAALGCGPTDFSCQCVSSKSVAINTAALAGVLKGCGAVTGLAVEKSASAVCACAASATPAEASTTSSSSTTSTSSTPAIVASTAAPTPTSTSPLPTTATTTSATSTSPSAGTGSGSTTSGSAGQFTGAAVRAIALIGGCLGGFIAVMAAL